MIDIIFLLAWNVNQVIFEDGTGVSDEYDYDVDYSDNGMAYIIEKDTKSSKYIIGVAWIDNVGWDDDDADNRDIQTWYATDQTLM